MHHLITQREGVMMEWKVAQHGGYEIGDLHL